MLAKMPRLVHSAHLSSIVITHSDQLRDQPVDKQPACHLTHQIGVVVYLFLDRWLLMVLRNSTVLS